MCFYSVKQHNIEKSCLNSTEDVYKGFESRKSCYSRIYQRIVPHLLIYDATVNGKPLEFVKLGKSEYGTYIVPEYALQMSDAVIGYGIEDDISFEEQYSNKYDKNSYGYDCGVEGISIKNKKCHFKSECIGTDTFVLEWQKQKSSKKIHSFAKNISKLGLNNKKYFVKMDIAGAEYDVIDDILKNSKNITGISIVIHMPTVDTILMADDLLKKIEKNFILVERYSHPNPFLKIKDANLYCPGTKGIFYENITLAYINKNLVDKYKVSKNQNNLTRRPEGSYDKMLYSDIKAPLLRELFIK